MSSFAADLAASSPGQVTNGCQTQRFIERHRHVDEDWIDGFTQAINEQLGEGPTQVRNAVKLWAARNDLDEAAVPSVQTISRCRRHICTAGNQHG